MNDDFNFLYPLSPNSDLGQIYFCRIKGLSVRDVANMIMQVKFY